MNILFRWRLYILCSSLFLCSIRVQAVQDQVAQRILMKHVIQKIIDTNTLDIAQMIDQVVDSGNETQIKAVGGLSIPLRNIWNVSKEILRKVCLIPRCDFVITQEDINITDCCPFGFTITGPGVYWLSENVTFTHQRAITINSQDVVLDLHGHGIDGKSMGSTGISLDGMNQKSNAIIKNGTIQNTTDDGIKIFDSLGQVLVSNMNVINAGANGISLEGTIRGMIIKETEASCNAAHGFNIDATATSICFLENKAFDNGLDGFAVNGNNIVLDSVVAGRNAGDGLDINGDNNIIRNSVANANLVNGFSVTGINDQIINSQSIENGGDGFEINGDNAILRDLVANNNSANGFEITSDNNQVLNSSSVSNTGNGFNVIGNDNQIISSYANENEQNGFTIAGDDNVACNSIASDNGADGFEIDGNNNSLRSNKAQANTGIGFDNTVGIGSNIFNNSSHNNGTNYLNVILVESAVTGITGYWQNVE